MCFCCANSCFLPVHKWDMCVENKSWKQKFLVLWWSEGSRPTFDEDFWSRSCCPTGEERSKGRIVPSMGCFTLLYGCDLDMLVPCHHQNNFYLLLNILICLQPFGVVRSQLNSRTSQSALGVFFFFLHSTSISPTQREQDFSQKNQNPFENHCLQWQAWKPPYIVCLHVTLAEIITIFKFCSFSIW